MLQAIKNDLLIKENEDTWEIKDQALSNIRKLSFEEFTPDCLLDLFTSKTLFDAFLGTLASSRTQLAISGCQTCSFIIQKFGASFEVLAEATFGCLLKVCNQTKKLVTTAAFQTMKTLIFNVPLVKYLPMILAGLQDKNTSLRVKVAESLGDLIAKVDFKSGNKGNAVELLEGCLRKTLGDGNMHVRGYGKNALEIYQLLWPEKILS